VVDRGTYLVPHRQQTDGAWLRALEVFIAGEPDEVRHVQKEET
jgi:hypothetical protein